MLDNTKSKILKWWVELKDYAGWFYKEYTKIDDEFKNFVKYDERVFDKIIAKYNIYRNWFHDLIKGSRMDRHKILAGIMLATTDKENLIFQVDDEAIKNSPLVDVPYWLANPNEFFLCKVLLKILRNYVLSTSKSTKRLLGKENYRIRFPDRVVWWDENITEPYEKQFCKLLYTLKENDNMTVKCLLLSSHLMFFYELAYDCAVKGLSRVYYNIAV